MKDGDVRHEDRRHVDLVEVVWVYRDQAGPSYEDALRFLRDNPEIHSVFNLVSKVHDASGQGLGLCFEGQEDSAVALLQPGEPYLLKLKLFQRDVPSAVAPYITHDTTGATLVFRATCRWYKHGGGRGRARMGFEMAAGNPAKIAAFVLERFAIGSRAPAST
jgi:hypothetical protein